MAIYIRNKQGDLNALNIPAIRGEKGADGVTPNIQIGTVTTLEPNQQATVTKKGTTENPIFDFGIPKGAKGEDGEASVQIPTNGLEGQFLVSNGDGTTAWITVKNANEVAY